MSRLLICTVQRTHKILNRLASLDLMTDWNTPCAPEEHEQSIEIIVMMPAEYSVIIILVSVWPVHPLWNLPASDTWRPQLTAAFSTSRCLFLQPSQIPSLEDPFGSRICSMKAWSLVSTSRWQASCASFALSILSNILICSQFASDVQGVSDRLTESVSSGDISSASRKKSRYLREQDRHDIVRRIAAGERQVDLAREYHVTKAAICHMKRKNAALLARCIYNNAAHPTRARYQAISKPLYVRIISKLGSAATDSSDLYGFTFRITKLNSENGKTQLPIVYEVRSSPIAILLTKLRDQQTGPQDFRLFADRAIRSDLIYDDLAPVDNPSLFDNGCISFSRLLLEEALACVATKSIELVAPTGWICEGIQAVQTCIGMALGETGFPMLKSFRTIYPESPTGTILDTISHPKESC